ncbi:MAG TPA: VOC family protein [Syntrophorhabdaceae bacterium]|nr:VOC family protein [Syntrophorhabdaceae bacterium]HPA07224.1 VOC family protein [Methanoregulaceae archaeon]
MFGKEYPRIHQLGFIVEDMDKAVREYSKIYHIKRWYHAANVMKDQIYYMGKNIKDDGFDVVIGYSGKLEIELITSTAEENIYVNFLRENGPGLHHVSYFVSDLDKAIQDYKDIGFELVQHGAMGNWSVVTRYAYLRPPNSRYGNIVELQQTRMFDKITVFRSGFLTWAGSFTGGAKRIK